MGVETNPRTQTTTYPCGEASPAEVKTSIEVGQSSRAFTAAHLDAIDAEMKTRMIAVAPRGITPPINHERFSDGKLMRFRIDHSIHEDAAAWRRRVMRFLAKVAIEHPSDV